MKVLVGAFNQEKALVGAFSVIVQLHRLIDLRHYRHSTYSDILWIRIIFSHGEDEGSRGDAGDQLAPVRGHLPL